MTAMQSYKSTFVWFYRFNMVIFDQVELKNWYINDVKKGEGRGEATVFTKEKVEAMGESESIKIVTNLCSS